MIELQLPKDDKWASIRRAHEGRDGALDLICVAHVERVYLHAERRGQGLNNAKLADSGWVRGIPQDRHSRHARRDLLQQLQPFSAQAVFVRHETGGVAARPCPAIDEAGGDRISDDRENKRHGAGHLQQWPTVEAPEARMTSGASAANSAACLRMSAPLVVAQRVSMRTLRPIVHPDCCSPGKNAPKRA